MRSLWVLLFLLSGEVGAVEIPRNLNRSDRQSALQVLGLGTSNKILTNPYPLGGYPGFEIGISYEFIALDDLSRLGDGTNQQDDLVYPRFSVGKGLYADVDIYFHFTPFSERSGLTDYGGFIKWTFYQAKFFPINLALIADGNISNIRDELVTDSIGVNLVNGVTVNNFSLYFGAGWVRSTGRFLGSPSSSSLTDSKLIETEVINEFHSLVGLTFFFDEIFFATQIDRFRDPVYSAKLGLRL